jgi:hypothetical protein
MSFGGGGFSAEVIAYLIHHLVLPPKLPQDDDSDPYLEHSLLRITIQALKEFQDCLCDPMQKQQVQSVLCTVSNLLNVRDTSGYVTESQLAQTLADFNTHEIRGAIPIEIKAQNAGILISRHDNSIVFESFELSPINQETMIAKGRLARSFPACAASLSMEIFGEAELRVSLARTIANLTSQPAPGFQPQVIKAKQSHDETRDTTNPGMVTDFFMNIISALGEATDFVPIWKNTREEVLWYQSKQPWRRSPLWLLLRVTMQLQFSRSMVISRPDESLYKPFTMFLLSMVLSLAGKLPQALDAELMWVTSAKLSRRIKKFEVLSQDTQSSLDWMVPICEILFRTQDMIGKSWKSILNRTNVAVNAKELNELQPEKECSVYVPGLEEFIAEIDTRQHVSSSSDFQPTIRCPEISADELPSHIEAHGEYRYFQLAAVERWVENHLGQWLNRHMGDQSAIGNLRDLIEEYHRVAKSIHADLPVSISIMYLTLMDLWVACDKLACSIHPLLCEFDPEVPTHLLQSLLLPLRDQMKRLCDVETYLYARKSRSSRNRPSLFRDFGHPVSFAVKFFDESPLHQALLSQIEQKATEKKEAKCSELLQKKQAYRYYMEQFDKIPECEYRWVVTDSYYGTEEYRHDKSSCHKCGWEAKATEIAIEVYEWPLSADPDVAKSTVFELAVPEAFCNWRDVTLMFLKSIFESTYLNNQSPRARYTLSTDGGLSPYFSQRDCRTRNVVLLSQVKPHVKTHRNNKEGTILNLVEEEVCVNNGLRYQYFDPAEDAFTNVWCHTERVPKQCTYKLPDKSFQLQKYLLRSPSQPDGVAPNEVIASQSECPSHISLDEYRAFGNLSLGHRIQYMNILTQLSMPALGFAKVETQLLIIQTVLRAGLGSTQHNVERASHAILAEDRFGNVLLEQLDENLQRVSANWESWRALASFVQLSTRLLTLAPSLQIQKSCRTYLDKSQKIALGWLNVIKSRARMSTDEGERAELYSKAVEIALLCIGTFDVDQCHLNEILREPSAASILLQCSIVVQENKENVTSEHDVLYCSMLQSWRYLSFRTCSMFKDEICHRGSKCLDDAISECWSAFHPTNSWQPLGSPYEHWVFMRPSSNRTV